MANKTLFQSIPGRQLPKTDTVNEARGAAYKLSRSHALAQYAATGCFNGTFYASAQLQLNRVVDLALYVDPSIVARTAIYAREQAFMKDLPALLVATLTVRAPELTPAVFDRVIDSPKMLRNFVQIMRSGAIGRKSLGTMPKRLVRRWLARRTDQQLFIGSVGADPSLADIIKMVHPRPASLQRAAMLGYLIGRKVDRSLLPPLVQQYEAFKNATPKNRKQMQAPDVPFQLLSSLKLTDQHWREIALRAPWQMTRMNLNTFLRHGVLKDQQVVQNIAQRLRERTQIQRARVFPYQLMAAYLNADGAIGNDLRDALQDAMEIALDNVPEVPGQVYVFPDVSGSMHAPATGYRQGATSKVRCVDIAALIAAAMLRRNPQTVVVPFESSAIPPRKVRLNRRDTVMTNATKLASLPAGGTNCSAPLAYLNKEKAKGDLVIYVSDNESWIDSPNYGWCGGSATKTMKEWERFRKRSPDARMICIDIQPYATTQAKERQDILNVAGFSDQVFEMIGAVARGQAQGGYWMKQIEQIVI